MFNLVLNGAFPGNKITVVHFADAMLILTVSWELCNHIKAVYMRQVQWKLVWNSLGSLSAPWKKDGILCGKFMHVNVGKFETKTKGTEEETCKIEWVSALGALECSFHWHCLSCQMPVSTRYFQLKNVSSSLTKAEIYFHEWVFYSFIANQFNTHTLSWVAWLKSKENIADRAISPVTIREAARSQETTEMLLHSL